MLCLVRYGAEAEIVRRYGEGGTTYPRLAAEYGCATITIYWIMRRNRERTDLDLFDDRH